MARPTRTEVDYPYAELFTLMTQAAGARFYLEASWIAYALIENRVTTALVLTGGVPTNRRGVPLQMLGPKLDHVAKRLKTDADLAKAAAQQRLDLGLLNRWKDDRNRLIHAMAEPGESWATLSKAAADLATRADSLVRSVNSTMLALKHLKTT